MIDKFNFYDVYGYFLPGAAIVLLFWLPFGLVQGKWPDSSLGSAVIGVAVAYFIGHLLQIICTKLVPSSVGKGKDKHDRYPSDVVIDQDNESLTTELKTNLEEVVRKRFKLEIGVDKPGSKALDRVRRDAFYCARHVLVKAKEVSYGEQFEGLYTLMRGLSAAFALGAANFCGWSLSLLHGKVLDCVVIVVITVSLLAAANINVRKDISLSLEKWSAFLLILTSMGLGYGMGRHNEVSILKSAELALCAVLALIVCVRTYGSYKRFSFLFAVTIWRDFYASCGGEQPAANKADNQKD